MSGSVAIIGGGISGLSCARRLNELGWKDVVVFDTGKRAVGGRSSSRTINNGSVIVDHVCQCFTAHSDRFKAIVDAWLQAGAVRAWGLGKCGTLKGGEFRPDQVPRYVGVHGMATLPAYLAQGLDVRRNIMTPVFLLFIPMLACCVQGLSLIHI